MLEPPVYKTFEYKRQKFKSKAESFYFRQGQVQYKNSTLLFVELVHDPTFSPVDFYTLLLAPY